MSTPFPPVRKRTAATIGFPFELQTSPPRHPIRFYFPFVNQSDTLLLERFVAIGYLLFEIVRVVNRIGVDGAGGGGGGTGEGKESTAGVM